MNKRSKRTRTTKQSRKARSKKAIFLKRLSKQVPIAKAEWRDRCAEIMAQAKTAMRAKAQYPVRVGKSLALANAFKNLAPLNGETVADAITRIVGEINERFERLQWAIEDLVEQEDKAENALNPDIELDQPRNIMVDDPILDIAKRQKPRGLKSKVGRP